MICTCCSCYNSSLLQYYRKARRLAIEKLIPEYNKRMRRPPSVTSIHMVHTMCVYVLYVCVLLLYAYVCICMCVMCMCTCVYNNYVVCCVYMYYVRVVCTCVVYICVHVCMCVCTCVEYIVLFLFTVVRLHNLAQSISHYVKPVVLIILSVKIA